MPKAYLFLSLFILIALSCNVPEDMPSGTSDLSPESGATIYGRVTFGDRPVAGCVVSDGVLTVATDAGGEYHLPSAKKNGYVFISVPSGYTVSLDSGNAPRFWKSLRKDTKTPERVDFTLMEEDQTDYSMIVMADIHLYNESSASMFVSSFVKELNEYVAAVSDVPVYGLTLGDMTWDWYWYANGFGIEQYLNRMDMLSDLPVYNTVGNHDHDMQYDSKTEFLTTGEDWTCMKKYRSLQGPTCFSYNIGGVHFVSLDNVITTDTGGMTDKDSRGNMRGVTDADMKWLKQDLSYVSDDTPVVVSVHIPLFGRTGKPSSGEASSVNSDVEDIVAPFARFGKVLFISGHTHLMYNTVGYDMDGVEVTEWNTGAVCGNFWNSAPVGLNVCADGTPGGYRILNVSNSGISTTYKAVGRKEGYAFRTYDRNQMNMDAASLKNYTTGKIAGPDADNWVYIRVWDYKPSWKITVREYDKELSVKKFESYDPLYMLMYLENVPVSEPKKTSNMFKVQASSKSSPLHITVTDEYGHSFTEIMERPKAFTLDTYIAEQAE